LKKGEGDGVPVTDAQLTPPPKPTRSNSWDAAFWDKVQSGKEASMRQGGPIHSNDSNSDATSEGSYMAIREGAAKLEKLLVEIPLSVALSVLTDMVSSMQNIKEEQSNSAGRSSEPSTTNDNPTPFPLSCECQRPPAGSRFAEDESERHLRKLQRNARSRLLGELRRGVMPRTSHATFSSSYNLQPLPESVFDFTKSTPKPWHRRLDLCAEHWKDQPGGGGAASNTSDDDSDIVAGASGLGPPSERIKPQKEKVSFANWAGSNLTKKTEPPPKRIYFPNCDQSSSMDPGCDSFDENMEASPEQSVEQDPPHNVGWPHFYTMNKDHFARKYSARKLHFARKRGGKKRSSDRKRNQGPKPLSPSTPLSPQGDSTNNGGFCGGGYPGSRFLKG